MNIAIIAHLKFPIVEPFYGGLEMHTFLLTRRLIEQGHEVTLYAARGTDPALNPLYPDTIPSRSSGIFCVAELPFAETERERRNMQIYTRIMEDIAKKDFDLVHNNSLNYVPLALASLLPCPIITTLHTPPFTSLSAGVRIANTAHNHYIVAVSEHLANVWLPITDTRAIVVPNGIDIGQWIGIYPVYYRTAVWTGRICPEKGLEYAIDAARISNFKLAIAGSIYDQDYFEKKIVPRLGDNVVYYGHLSHDELKPIISMSQCGLFTSVWDEPFGLVLTEMLACGTPVVAFDSGAASEIINQKTGVIVPKFDVEGMARAMWDTANLNRLDCKAHVRTNFSCGSMVGAYESLYDRACVIASQNPVGAITDAAVDNYTNVA